MTLNFYDIYKIFKWLPLKGLFKDYICKKTQFSYDLFEIPNVVVDKRVNLIEDKNYTKKERKEFFDKLAGSNKNKFAEFVYILLSEYIVLHNYMWSSRLKPKGLKTLDKFMRNIN